MNNFNNGVLNVKLLRIAASLLVAGVVISIAVGLLHPAREDPNNHPAVFAEYAASEIWTAVHLGQFAGMALLLSGFIVLGQALNAQSGSSAWVYHLAMIAAVAALALYAVLQAVDGVVLKHAVIAWVTAPVTEKAARFANAETVRWAEEGFRSYQDILFGVTSLLTAAVIISTARIPRIIGYLMGLSGLVYLAQGWLVGTEGFSPAHGATQLPAYGLILFWILWLTVIAFGQTEKQEKAQVTG